MENVIIGFVTDNSYKCITLSSSILPEDRTAEPCTEAVLNTFKEGRALLTMWCTKTKTMYPNRSNLLDIIPLLSELDIDKLYKGTLMTNTCDQACKQCCLLAEGIRVAMQAMSKSNKQIRIFELTVGITFAMFGLEQLQNRCPRPC